MDMEIHSKLRKAKRMRMTNIYKKALGLALLLVVALVLTSCSSKKKPSISEEYYLAAMERSPVKHTEINVLLHAALTDDTENRAVFMHSIDASYRYEGYTRYKTEEV